MSSVVIQNGGGLKLLGTVSGNSSKSANYFDSIGANDYGFVYILAKGVIGSSEIRGGLLIPSDFISLVGTATRNIQLNIMGDTSSTATVTYRKTNNDWYFNPLSGTTMTFSIYGVAI